MAPLQNTSDATSANQPAADSQINKLMATSEREGNSYHVQLMELLNNKASEAVFKNFFESQFYTSPLIKKREPNDYRRGVCAL